MSVTNDVLTAMKMNCIYRPCDLAAMLRGSSTREITRILSLLNKGGMIELIKGDEYRRKKMYTTKQRSLL